MTDAKPLLTDANHPLIHAVRIEDPTIINAVPGGEGEGKTLYLLTVVAITNLGEAARYTAPQGRILVDENAPGSELMTHHLSYLLGEPTDFYEAHQAIRRPWEVSRDEFRENGGVVTVI